MPTTDNDVINQLRIDVAILKAELVYTEKALKLAHSNIISWIGLAVTITAVIVTVLLKLVH